MERAGYYRKYIILKELDQGFGVHLPPEGFVRLEGNKDGVTISLQTRNLREGTEPYTVILVYGKDKDIGLYEQVLWRSWVKTVFQTKIGL